MVFEIYVMVGLVVRLIVSVTDCFNLLVRITYKILGGPQMGDSMLKSTEER